MTRHYLTWLVGPVLAVAMVATVFGVNGGPGLLFLALCGGLGFLFAMPLAQLMLLKTSRYQHRPMAACWIAFLAVLASLVLLSLAGVFSFW